MLALVLIAAPTLQAQDLRAWQGMYEGMLLESVEGDLQRSSSWYEGLIDGLSEQDPSQGELHYWLGRTRYLMGETREAREILFEATAHPEARDRAGALLGQIDAMEILVRELPVRYDFSDGPGPWLHPWYYAEQGELTVSTFEKDGPTPNEVLTWTTLVTARQDDHIYLGFAEGAAPVAFSLKVRSEVFPAWLLVAVEDDAGRGWRLSNAAVAPTDDWATISFRATDLQPLDGEAGSPGAIRQLLLIERTARSSFDRGENTLYIDDVRIR